MDTLANPNKQLLQAIFAGLARGDAKPFLDSLADDFCWTVPGTNAWSGTYRGKQAVRDNLLRPLFANFASQYTNAAHRFIAQDDWVVVECRGKVTTKAGNAYDNQYCWVCRVEGDQLKEVVEYMDTELVVRVLEK
ncbi:MAG: nuclear transport factor 2 family protein [Burkholderiales bacterium]|nr:nuclear transport factor 2 family protein [Burkholderiales bacterium]